MFWLPDHIQKAFAQEHRYVTVGVKIYGPPATQGGVKGHIVFLDLLK